MAQFANGYAAYQVGYAGGLKPDPEVWIDEWADEYMRIPADAGAAEPGPYHTARTPYAREVMRCLSIKHPAKRIVAKAASQMLKTQVALNWIGASIHMAPSNILALMPSQPLATRLSGRIAKTIAATPVLRNLVASPRSRDARNTLDTKEFRGGSIYIATAGSAANLSELSVRYVFGDEISRWERNVDKEGSPRLLAEKRGNTFGRNAKFYYTSSPTIKGACEISSLFEQSDQRHYYVPCPHCGHRQVLKWEQLRWNDSYTLVQYLCEGPECGALFDESSKKAWLADGEWRAHAVGDGETVGFHLNALYMPLGWTSWADLAREYDEAKIDEELGDPEPMQVFLNTRMALEWSNTQQSSRWKDLMARAENYRLGTIPLGAYVLTASVDVQHNRLELKVVGWGAGLERWIVDYQVIIGDPAIEQTWAILDERLQAEYRHPGGQAMRIAATAVDSGGHHTNEVYQFTRLRKWRNVLAIKGASKPNKPVLAQRASKVDISWQGKVEPEGAELWIIGTDTAKDWIYNRYHLVNGPGAVHFSTDLDEDFYKQVCAESKIRRFIKGREYFEWIKPRSQANEALDLSVYNLAMAHYLGLHKYGQAQWDALQARFAQSGLFDMPPPAAPPDDDEAVSPAEASPPQPKQEPKRPAPAGRSVSQPQPARRASRSSYLGRR